MNKELLLEIKERILREPDRFIMDDFFSVDVQCDFSLTKECGTAACIAGWALFLNSNKDGYLNILRLEGYEKPAAAILGLTEGQANDLFYEGFWPDQFKALDDEESSSTLASRAAARIDHLIATGE